MKSHRTLGYLGLAWALSYVPIHVYWALGGLATSFGIVDMQPGWAAANWGACVVIVGAGLTCLSLEQRWGQLLPHAVRYGTAWVGGVFGLTHWLLFTVVAVLRLSGMIDYSTGRSTVAQQRAFDWANLGYFELWFGVMGVLLILCAQRSRARQRRVEHVPISLWGRVGTALTLAGLATVVLGVFTFDPWAFVGYGPALLGLGLLTLIVNYKREIGNETPQMGISGRGLGHHIRRTAHLLGNRTH
ncbi:MAG: hypothetical protein DLM58_02880 [Pseudonocardiales bacterium]|nr:MAG: hypothetical protein DLM58_02880 [Pseudonocardiales bacterium]